jgi:hypothetical protein
MLTMYISSIARCIISLHDLVSNKMDIRDTEKSSTITEKKTEIKKEEKKEEKKKE